MLSTRAITGLNHEATAGYTGHSMHVDQYHARTGHPKVLLDHMLITCCIMPEHAHDDILLYPLLYPPITPH